MKTRFAPSPTGFLHVGNIRTAIIQYLYAKSQGGEFLLRFDDTDVERCREEYADQILEDLKFLGLKWDGKIYRQMERLELYEEYKQKLMAEGKVYACYETPEELNLMRKSMQARGVPPIYNRQALKLHPDKIAEYQAEGRKPHYRFLLEDRTIEWNDGVKGLIKYKERSFSDPIIFRENGMPMYVFASVVDDVEMGITDIIRGEDHITNTAVQLQIFEALGHRPNFTHLTLVQSPDGKISKRIGGFSIKEIREQGLEAMSVLNLLGQLGTGAAEVYKNLQELQDNFQLQHFSKAAPNYRHEDLQKMNEKYLHNCDFKTIEPRLKELNFNITEQFWDIAKQNIMVLQDLTEWIRICSSGLKIDKTALTDEDREVINVAKSLLPEELTADTIAQWFKNITEKTGKSGAKLFMPLRLALTNSEHGPNLKELMPLIGREEILRRLVL